jgi:hypothetical protein
VEGSIEGVVISTAAKRNPQKYPYSRDVTVESILPSVLNNQNLKFTKQNF